MGPFPMREVWACVSVGVGANDDDAIEDRCNSRQRRRTRGLGKLTINAQILKVAEMVWAAVKRARARSSAAETGAKGGGDHYQGNVKMSSKHDDNRPPLIPSLEELHLTLRTDSSSSSGSSNGNGPFKLMPLLALIFTLIYIKVLVRLAQRKGLWLFRRLPWQLQLQWK